MPGMEKNSKGNVALGLAKAEYREKGAAKHRIGCAEYGEVRHRRSLERPGKGGKPRF